VWGDADYVWTSSTCSIDGTTYGECKTADGVVVAGFTSKAGCESYQHCTRDGIATGMDKTTCITQNNCLWSGGALENHCGLSASVVDAASADDEAACEAKECVPEVAEVAKQDAYCSVAFTKEGEQTNEEACNAAEPSVCDWHGATTRECLWTYEREAIEGWSYPSTCSDSKVSWLTTPWMRSRHMTQDANAHYGYSYDAEDAGLLPDHATDARDKFHARDPAYYTCADGAMNGDEADADCGATHTRTYGTVKEEVCNACSPPPSPPSPAPPGGLLGDVAVSGATSLVTSSLLSLVVAAVWLKMM